MNEQYPRRQDGPWTEGGHDNRDRSALPDHLNPTEQFPTARYPAEQFPTERLPTAESVERYSGHREPEPYARPAGPRPVEPQPFARPAEPQPYGRPAEPLAHEGGFPYGMPPAAPYGAPSPYGYGDPYIPQHLHVPPPQFQQGPYPQQFGYPPMQQTVYVHGAPAKRVNHALHLILTIVTFGLWLPVWIILAIANS
ncbi:hypothetical protein [Dietzia lutea]|uniref:hypothetical protein n=1 Tax=Dietzia lutea TaxID=546160 RepID=UPI000D54C29A|nr:hypothetical protein [Dietzia lutea]